MAVSGTDFDPQVLSALRQVIDNEGEAATAPFTTSDQLVTMSDHQR
jgi:hypothetical protein